jgi:hypothetical protein
MKVLNEFLSKVVVQIINPIILLLAGAALVLFLWGVFELIRGAADETKRAEGRRAILWGLVGLVIIFGAYGIINVALNTFNLPTLRPGDISQPR